MAKTLVVERDGRETKVPFLRGILTRSLQDAGLPFDDAYSLASMVREELTETEEISAIELHDVVLRHLKNKYGPTVVQRYQVPLAGGRTVFVRHVNGKTTPFSREQHRRHLESSGLTYEASSTVTTKIYDHLMKKGAEEISSRYLGRLTYAYLRRSLGSDAARRYLVLVDFFRGNRPLVLLIGGAPGTGKSAVAMEIAHRLEIGRSQSTDLLREVMRMMIPERMLPVLHTSSFNAWWKLPRNSRNADDPDSELAAGYRAQAELVSVACEAVIKRSLSEQTSLILEGVHIDNYLLAKLPKETNAVVVPVMLAVLNADLLRGRIVRRGDQVSNRRADRYLESFDAIWRLQSILLSDADRWNMPIIPNSHQEQVIRDVTRTVVDHLMVDFSAPLDEVFV